MSSEKPLRSLLLVGIIAFLLAGGTLMAQSDKSHISVKMRIEW